MFDWYSVHDAAGRGFTGGLISSSILYRYNPLRINIIPMPGWERLCRIISAVASKLHWSCYEPVSLTGRILQESAGVFFR
jgi:hypothetical protein